MGLAYPLAPDARSALNADEATFVSTLADAMKASSVRVALHTAWIRPDPDEVDAIAERVPSWMGSGFVQSYENENGQLLLAVTFWKPVTPEEAEAERIREAKIKADARIDNLDDTYFSKPEVRRKRHGLKPRRLRSWTHESQLELFPGDENTDPAEDAPAPEDSAQTSPDPDPNI